MNIKPMIIRTAMRVERLVQSIFGVSVALVPPARASLAESPPARAGKPITNSIQANAESPQTPLAKRRSKPTSSKVKVLPLEQRRWLTVKETSARFPCFSEKSLRHLIYSAEAYANYPKAGLRSNGFLACISRPAGQRKIIIDAAKFEDWLAAGAIIGRKG